MTTAVDRILRAHPGQFEGVARDQLLACIDACTTCAQACSACADACLAEPRTDDLLANVRSSLDCADVCAATARVLSRDSAGRMDLVVSLLRACLTACQACGVTCESAAGDGPDHVGACRAACAQCADACRQLLTHLGAEVGAPRTM
jgi:hypothetical protein